MVTLHKQTDRTGVVCAKRTSKVVGNISCRLEQQLSPVLVQL